MTEEKKKSSSGAGLGIDFNLNPCAPVLLILVLPPLVLLVWLLVR